MNKPTPSIIRMTRPRSTVSKLVLYHPRLWLAVLLGIGIFVFCPVRWSGITRLVTAWNGAVLFLLPLLYIWASRLDPAELRARYEDEDPTGPVILLVVVIAALLSFLAIVALLSTLKQVPPSARTGHLVLASLTVMSSWLVVPTMFTLHYADMYYSADPGGDPPLTFPQTRDPVFWDFIYFSFTIAVACQTADVATNDAKVRRAVIFHGVVSFFFNVFIVGFAINVTAGLLGAN